jgi:hypothetical protein
LVGSIDKTGGHMRRILCIIAFFLLTLSGCEGISPKLEQNLNNQNGRIDRIENNQNSIRGEIDRLSLINKENNNSGVQILQGDGTYILIFGIVTVGLICFYFHKVAENYRKIVEIFAQEIRDNPKLKMRCLKAAQHTEVEKQVHRLFKT